jgi:choline dehydrogenase
MGTAMWDYVIVGAGSAGCVLANRLSADGRNRVLLLEAGGSDDGLRYKVTALLTSCINNPESDWMFYTEADPTRHGKTELASRGKVLGGTSTINGTIYVRGNRGDYDHWGQLGNTGWEYDDVVPYFRKVEKGFVAGTDTYGTSGKIAISELRGAPHLSNVFVKAMQEFGVPHNRSYNGEDSFGASIVHATQRLGFRFSAARGYLHPIRNRPNLKVVTGAMVRRVLFEGCTASGVEYELDGRLVVEKANQVIVSASVFNSPKLLMHSGVGPAEHLRENGIEVVHHSPGVGRNLHDHAAVGVKVFVNTRTVNMDDNLPGRIKHGLRFALTLGGPASYVHSAVAFVKTRPELVDPDIEFQFCAFGFDYTPEGWKMLERPAVMLQPNVNRSRSRGHVALRSSDPRDPPKISMNLLSDPYDLDTLVAGAKMARRILNAKAFAPYVVDEYSPGKGVQRDEEWAAFVRENASHISHACGTCKMGVDPQAVVDPRLRVIGVNNLRVVDSSIIPQVPSANLNAISMAIGEKGSNMILEDVRHTS